MAKGYIIGIGYNKFLSIWDLFHDDFTLMSNDPKDIIEIAAFSEAALDDENCKCIVFKTEEDALNFIKHYQTVYDTLPGCMTYELPCIDSMSILKASDFPYKRKLLKLM